MYKKLLLLVFVSVGLDAGIEVRRPSFHSKYNINLYYGSKKGFVVVDYKKVHFIQRCFTDSLLRGATEEDIMNYVIEGNGYFQVVKLSSGPSSTDYTYAIKARQRLLGGGKGGFFKGVVLTVSSLWDRKCKKETTDMYVEEKEAAIKFAGEYVGSYAGGVLNVVAGEAEDFVRRFTTIHAIKVIHRFNEGVELSNETKVEIKKALDLELSKYSGFDQRGTHRESSDDQFVSRVVKIKPRISERLKTRRLEAEELLRSVPAETAHYSNRWKERLSIDTGDTTEVINPMDLTSTTRDNVTPGNTYVFPGRDIQESNVIEEDLSINPISLTNTSREQMEFDMTPALPDGTPINIHESNISEQSFDVESMSSAVTIPEMLKLQKKRYSSRNTSYLARDTISSNGNRVIPESEETALGRINMHYDTAEQDTTVSDTSITSDDTPEWLTRIRESANSDLNGVSVSDGPYEFGARVDYNAIRSGRGILGCIELFLQYKDLF